MKEKRMMHSFPWTPLRLKKGRFGFPLANRVDDRKVLFRVTSQDADTGRELYFVNHSEETLTRVSAEYSLRPDGGVRVLNRGFNAAKNRWQEAEGRAYFVLDPNTAYLKVSFFGPFYGAYIVTELDPDYRHVLVSGPNHDYLWILARTTQLETAVRDRLVARAKALGFATDELIWVEH